MTRGAVIVAHGSGNADWKVLLGDCLQQVGLPAWPGEVVNYNQLGWVGSAVLDPNCAGVEAAIRQIQALGVSETRIIPLFVCDASSHLSELARLCNQLGQVTLGHALNDSPFVVQVLVDRYLEVVREHHPDKTAVILVGHGTSTKEDQAVWAKWATHTGEELFRLLINRPELQRVSVASLHPDNLVERVSMDLQKSSVVLLPLFLSDGYYTLRVIPRKLRGLPYLMGSPYLPHPLISDWVTAQLAEYFAGSLDH